MSRTFHRPDEPGAAVHNFEAEVAALRQAEQALRARTPGQVAADRLRISAVIGSVAASMAPRAAESAA